MQSNKFQLLLVTAILASCLILPTCAELNCLYCYSDISETCITNPTEIGTVPCDTGCATYQATNGSIFRGCINPAPTSILSSQVCTTDKCNSNLVCKQCLGENSCAVPSELPKTSEICASDQTACITVFNANSTVSRSCGNAATCTNTDTTQCSSCSGGLCNNNVFPEDRLQCYKCTGDGCNAVNSTMLTPCALSNAKCYTIGTSDTTMQRGCTSETNAKCTEGTTDANCLLCNKTECNNLTFNRDGGSCVTCTGCSGLQDAATGAVCGNSNYTQNVGCFTQNVNGVVNRGCLNALNVACTNDNECTSCDTTNCNIESTFNCLRCNSNSNPECRKGNVSGTPCDNEKVNKCFEGMWGDLVVRDCWDQASDLMAYQCENNLYNCKGCTTNNCNNLPFSGASFIHISLSLMMASMGFLFIRLI